MSSTKYPGQVLNHILIGLTLNLKDQHRLQTSHLFLQVTCQACDTDRLLCVCVSGDFRLKYTDPHSFEADQTDGHERGPRQCFVSHYSKDSRKCFHGLSFSPIVLLCKYADLFLCREWNPVSFSDFSEDGGILHWRQVQDRLTFSDQSTSLKKETHVFKWCGGKLAFNKD